jgi:hypothetical protein
MATPSQNTSQIISLPKGGGALKGIGETFSPDLFTGTGNFSVPIVVPPPRKSFQTQLNLVLLHWQYQPPPLIRTQIGFFAKASQEFGPMNFGGDLSAPTGPWVTG